MEYLENSNSNPWLMFYSKLLEKLKNSISNETDNILALSNVMFLSHLTLSKQFIL